MKKVFSILAAVLLSATVWAQSPEKMSYQAVIRNSSNQLVTGQSVGMQISILQGSSSGTAVYVETQTPTTNANGLVSLEIGAGTVVSGNFATIDWANGLYFIKTETDPAGGSNYTITGTSQLLSVPYALHAKTAESIISGTTLNIGDSYQGGIIFWIDATGQHGLIAATTDQSTGMRWYAGTNTNTMAFANGVGAGIANTSIIIANQGYGDGDTYAARICNEYSVTTGGVTYGDWYLPSKYELNLLYQQKTVVGGFSNDTYWSSSEYTNGAAFAQVFLDGYIDWAGKNSLFYVRAVRRF